MASVPKIGISSCLLGEKVRYDGGHKLDRYLTEVLGPLVSYLPVCPEMGADLPVPREPMRLEGDPASPRLVTVSTRIDLTERMTTFCREQAAALEGEELCGFIFKKGSPSSGLHRVKIYNPGGAVRSGRGLFARAVTERFPNLPVEEEGRLSDPALREHFLERVFACRRWKDFRRDDGGLGGLVKFHACHKLQLMSHNPQLYREIGRLVANGQSLEREALLDRYEGLYMRTLGFRATARKHVDVMMHMMGYFKKQLSSADKAELLDLLDRYRLGTVPLAAPLALISHYVRRFDQGYLKQQTYLDPYPAEALPNSRR